MQAGPNIFVWEVESGTCVSVLAVDYGGAKSLAFSPDGDSLVSVGRGGSWWDEPAKPSVVSPRPRDHGDSGRAPDRVGFSPSGRYVYSTLGVVYIEKDGPGKPALTLDNPVGWAAVNDLAFTRDETRLAVAYQSTTAAVFDLRGPPGRTVLLEGHTNKQIRAIGFTPDGRTVVTVGNDGTSRFWDAATGASLRVFDWGLGVLATAAFAPDGLTCAAGSAKGKVVVWDLDV